MLAIKIKLTKTSSLSSTLYIYLNLDFINTFLMYVYLFKL